jgi:hypothetical protein
MCLSTAVSHDLWWSRCSLCFVEMQPSIIIEGSCAKGMWFNFNKLLGCNRKYLYNTAPLRDSVFYCNAVTNHLSFTVIRATLYVWKGLKLKLDFGQNSNHPVFQAYPSTSCTWHRPFSTHWTVRCTLAKVQFTQLLYQMETFLKKICITVSGIWCKVCVPPAYTYFLC